jgi:hypothetical protein
MDKVTGEWRKIHNEELSDLYCSPIIVQVIKLRKMRWAGHVARMGRGEAYTGFWWGNLRERDHLEDLGIDGVDIKLELKEVGCGGMDSIELAQGTDRWWALVNGVMTFGFHKMRGTS